MKSPPGVLGPPFGGIPASTNTNRAAPAPLPTAIGGRKYPAPLCPEDQIDVDRDRRLGGSDERERVAALSSFTQVGQANVVPELPQDVSGGPPGRWTNQWAVDENDPHVHQRAR